MDRDRLLKFREIVEEYAKSNKDDKLQITFEELFDFCKTLGVDKSKLCDEVLICIDEMQRSIPQVIIEIYGKKGYICIVNIDKNSIVLQEGETIAYKWITKAEFLEFCESELFVTVLRYRLDEFIKNHISE